MEIWRLASGGIILSAHLRPISKEEAVKNTPENLPPSMCKYVRISVLFSHCLFVGWDHNQQLGCCPLQSLVFCVVDSSVASVRPHTVQPALWRPKHGGLGTEADADAAAA